MDDSGPLSTTLCPRCGVAVATGYVKCPRCHAEQAGRSRRPSRPPTYGGGTSVGPGMDRTVIYIIAGAVVVIALTAWLLLRDDGKATASAEPTPDDETAVDDGTEPDVDQGAELPPDRLPTPPPPPTPAPDPSIAIGSLGRALRAERMWATVTADGDVVVIDSSLCDDPALAAIVDASVGELRAVELKTVRCRAPHGAVVFERGL